MTQWSAKLSRVLLAASVSIWSRQFLPQAGTNLEKTLNGVVSVVVFFIDIVDVVFDCIFAKRVVEEMEGGSLEWGVALVVGTIISHLVDVKSLFLDMTLAETCVTELAIFYVEDVTMIMLIGNVHGAYDPSDFLDVATVWFSAISALVTLFQLLVQLFHATQVYSSKGLARRIGVLICAIFPSILFMGLLGELLIDGALTFDDGVIHWLTVVSYGLGVTFGLVISIRVLLRPISATTTNEESAEDQSCNSDKSDSHTGYVLT